MEKAYELGRNVDHLRSNEDCDVWQAGKKLEEKIDLFWELKPIKKLPTYRFEGKLEKRLSWLDYPDSYFGYPIISKRMVKILLSLGLFRHQAIPLKIYDWKSGEKTDDFVFLHLLECIDVLDREKTEYYRASGRVSEAALKEPKTGYPPIFRVKDAGLARFISAEAKEALEAADIKGVRFIPLIAS